MGLNAQKFFRKFLRLLSARFRLISVAMIVVILTLGYVLFLSPKISEVRRVGVFDLARTKEQLRLKQEIFDATQRLSNIYDTLGLDDVTRLASVLPKEQDLPAMFVQVDALARASGLQLDNVGFTDLTAAAKGGASPSATEGGAAATAPAAALTPQPTGSRDVLRKMSVTFSVSGGGGYEDLKRFMTNVESSIRLLDVQSFAYTPGDQQEKYQVNAITYYLAQ